MLKVPVISSKSLGELYGKIKRSDPLSGNRIIHAKINGVEIYNVLEADSQNVPLMSGDVVTFHPAEGSFGIGFASDK